MEKYDIATAIRRLTTREQQMKAAYDALNTLLHGTYMSDEDRDEIRKMKRALSMLSDKFEIETYDFIKSATKEAS